MADNLTAIGNKASVEARRRPFRRSYDADDLNAQIVNPRRLLRQANRKGHPRPRRCGRGDLHDRRSPERAPARHRAQDQVLERPTACSMTAPTDRARRHYRVAFYITLILLLVTQCYKHSRAGRADVGTARRTATSNSSAGIWPALYLSRQLGEPMGQGIHHTDTSHHVDRGVLLLVSTELRDVGQHCGRVELEGRCGIRNGFIGHSAC
jgi:hypothetical protein